MFFGRETMGPIISQTLYPECHTASQKNLYYKSKEKNVRFAVKNGN